MSFEWSEYLEFSKELIYPTGRYLNPANEAALRASTSRVYYAVFCSSRNYLRDVERDYIVIKTYNNDTSELKRRGLTIHQYVQNEFNADPAKRSIANNMKRLKFRRVKADYHDDYANISKEIKTSISYAKKALDELNKLTP